MGEYLTVNNKNVKIGTCENMYYATLKQLKQAEHDGVEDASEYTKPKNGFRYRFPFPDEDIIEMGNHGDYDRGFTVPMPYDWINEMVDHKEICVRTEVDGQMGYAVNHYIICPGSKDWKRTCSERTSKVPFQIVQQKQVNKQLWTVGRCGWCKALFRIPSILIEPLIGALNEYNDEEHTKIADRILEGYH